jgi:hypothetical protein
MVIFVALAACAVAADDSSAQRANSKPKPAPPPVEGSDSVPTDQKERLEFFVSRLKELRMHGLDEPGRSVSFVETPVFSFNNPVSSISDGFMFIWTDNWGIKDPTDWQLRLLTTPLYRYEFPEENVVDGALFGYVLTTSPEALVLLEARSAGGKLTWHYMVSRLTRFGTIFSLDEQKIAEFPRLDAWPPTGTYFHDPVPMPDYPFKNETKAITPKE